MKFRHWENAQHKECEVDRKDCAKEDAESEEESSMSDSTRNKKQEDHGVKMEEESSDVMVEVTEVVDSDVLQCPESER